MNGIPLNVCDLKCTDATQRRKNWTTIFQQMCFFFFLRTLAICLILQKIFPFRKIPLVKIRFLINISLHLVNTFLVYIAIALLVGSDQSVFYDSNWDLFSLSNFPYWSQLLLLFLFDMTIYWQHRFFIASLFSGDSTLFITATLNYRRVLLLDFIPLK